MGAAPIPPRCMHAARMPTSLTPGFGASETSPASSSGSGSSSSTTATTGREHGDDGIEQAGFGTSPTQLAAAAAAAVPRHHHRHHRPRAWGRWHRASWGRHKPSPASSGGSGSSTASPPAACMGTTGTSPASSGGSGSSTTATTGREHGEDGIEQAGFGTSAVARPEAAVAPPPTEAIYQQVSSADYGQRRSKRQPHCRRKHRVSVANGELGRILQPSVAAL
ncbi:hypothetical protein PF011_g25500 [Phytophthora fragariae]|uniref:Uncharacterized protein n=1 Tax=Phytophthora fragariae TaxID=53985 RepID=A0A6A3HQF0_9STRA|nr:hypothetical protein PF011_g25500 [Phytophthora fragariae]